jgi:uncharacterized protein YjiS (DUF1127 family)
MEAAMNQAQHMSDPWADALADALAGIYMKSRTAIRAFAEMRARTAAVDALEALSDRRLRDMGLHRGQIRPAVYGEPL